MAETNPPNPESPRTEDQEHADLHSEPQEQEGAAAEDKAQNLRGGESSDDADAPPNDSAANIAEEAIETAERATAKIKRQAGVEDHLAEDSDQGNTETHPAAMGSDTPGTDKLDLPDFTESRNGAQSQTANSSDLHLLDDIDLDVTVELGRTEMYVEDVLKLNESSVVELDKAAGDPVDIYVNNRHIARGEVLVLNENFCVRISEIISQDEEV